MCALFAIEKESKIIYINMYKGWNIFSATANGRCDIIKKLIEQGCDVNSRDSKGNPVLYHAIIHNQNAAFDLLRKYGAPKSSRDFELLINTALSYRNLNFLESLISDVNIPLLPLDCFGSRYRVYDIFRISLYDSFYCDVCNIILKYTTSMKKERSFMIFLLKELYERYGYSGKYSKLILWGYVKTSVEKYGDANVFYRKFFIRRTFIRCARKHKNRSMELFLRKYSK